MTTVLETIKEEVSISDQLLVGCISSLNPIGKIKTRFFHLDSQTGDIKDVTLELCKVIKIFNEKAKQVRDTGAYAQLIPYDYKDGMASYSHGCGLTHYLHTDTFEELVKAQEKPLSFPLTECRISMFTPSDVKDILACKGVFDEKIESAIKEHHCK